MKAEELRIGNLVSYGKDVVKISASDFAVYQLYKLRGDEVYYKPIPLTEEWLRKFGFNRANKKKDIFPKSFIKDNVMESRLYFRPSYKGGYYWGFLTTEQGHETAYEFSDVEHTLYVHQLQNLYFALTGEELTQKS